ncbi:retinaldehyde-binding protein 1-like isoform X2 [Planococcus citri]|uniref:retinaldehyde-binding protein 1-like isoform X2 n=1 Tax=Planococcus citri TaxID=170843 RepID=UPI0031F9C817
MKILDSKSQKEEEIIREICQWVEKNNANPEYKENEYAIRLQYKFFGCDVAKVKKNLSLYYKKRSQVITQYGRYDNIYENLRNSYDMVAGGLLPEKNPFEHSVIIVKVTNYDKDINFMDGQMRLILAVETLQKEDLLGKKVICVIDYSGISLSYLFKLNIFALQKAYKTWKDFAFLSCSEIHHINMPLYSHYIVNLANYILDEKLKKVNYYHTENLSEFYEHVPKEILPKEYGGNAPEIKELSGF